MNAIYKMVILAGVLAMTGCAGQRALDRNMQAVLDGSGVTPPQLKEKDGKVGFTYTLKLPARAFGRNQTLKMTPVMKFGGKTFYLDPVMLQGQGVKMTSYPVVKHRETFEIACFYELMYQPEMEKAVLLLKPEVASCGKSFELPEMVMNAKGVLPQPEADRQGEKHAEMTGEIRAIVMFNMAEDKIISGQDYMKYTRANLDTVMAYPGAEITSVELLTSCSPDGNRVFNEQLGENRYRVARRFFEKQLNLVRFSSYRNPGIFTHRTISQNWQGLYDLIEDSRITSADELIKQLKALPLAERELLLQKAMTEYPIIKEELLPLLRNSQLIIRYKTPWHEQKTRILPGVW